MPILHFQLDQNFLNIPYFPHFHKIAKWNLCVIKIIATQRLLIEYYKMDIDSRMQKYLLYLSSETGQSSKI